METVALLRNPDHQRLGDRVARTRVVRKEALTSLALRLPWEHVRIRPRS
ncbi:MAG: hypothetical protein OEM42_01195 [Deltaproteobacteria bacterium]|nr:hypothetical protein [Deltaproteobacteria bacterium]